MSIGSINALDYRSYICDVTAVEPLGRSSRTADALISHLRNFGALNPDQQADVDTVHFTDEWEPFPEFDADRDAFSVTSWEMSPGETVSHSTAASYMVVPAHCHPNGILKYSIPNGWVTMSGSVSVPTAWIPTTQEKCRKLALVTEIE